MQAKTGTTHAPLVSVVLMQAEFSNNYKTIVLLSRKSVQLIQSNIKPPLFLCRAVCESNSLLSDK
jgi:hypothetical protein